jgi:hypothetical protein
VKNAPRETLPALVRRAVRQRRAQVTGTPEWRWDRQWPVFRCPWVEPCTRTWDRREISDGGLRAELWDHAHEHLPGEHAHILGDRWARSVMDKETWS